MRRDERRQEAVAAADLEPVTEPAGRHAVEHGGELAPALARARRRPRLADTHAAQYGLAPRGEAIGASSGVRPPGRAPRARGP